MPPKFKKPTTAAATSTSPSSSKGPVVLYWFRTDLRLHDSPALTHALSLSPSAFYPVWTWDPHYVYRARVGPNRWKFLLECQRDLSASLTRLNAKQKLWLVREAPVTVLPKLVGQWGVDVVVCEKDTDAYARQRDEEVHAALERAGLKTKFVVVEGSRTLFDPDELVKHNGGRPTMSMSQVVKASEKIDKGVVKRPLDPPSSLPDPASQGVDLSGFEQEKPNKTPDFNQAHRQTKGQEQGDKQYTAGIAGPKGDFGVPTLEEMGIDPSSATSPHQGGETAALALLKKYIDDEDYVGTFEKPASAPTDFSPQSTTLLSPHHHFGSLSVRKFWWDVQDVFARRKKQGKKVATEPENLLGQLLFRDMYFGAQAALGWKFSQTLGNPVARFIPWRLQSRYSDSAVGSVRLLDGTYEIDDKQAEEWFRRWKEGRTGFPWIDALMRQLKTEGWIHHLGRHAVACFLTRGGCYVHWERGAEVFEEWLVDHETSCNVGNWMWLSCTAFYSMFYRCYSPVAFPKKWDPEGNFVRRYVPELKEYGAKHIYEPHKAPMQDQKKWGCVIKGDGEETEHGNLKVYPKPMLDFNERRKYCMDKMKEAYDVGMHGDDERVMSGKWKKVFGFKDEGDGKVKDETNGAVDQGVKRTRQDKEGKENDGGGGDEEDGGAEAEAGDITADEPPKKAAKKATEEKDKKGQKTLDNIVSRRKTKK